MPIFPARVPEWAVRPAGAWEWGIIVKRQVEPGSEPTADDLLRVMRDTSQESLARRLAEAIAAESHVAAILPRQRGASRLS
ncbi:hypothetical protein GCM10022247_59240 [Allokutzneria multivorans]|uniref:Uncharacterized protein n=1 Tax=Allokutzneria multivorans TaxID=1142134 RepID=A0ABP7THW4_9PSEU